MVNNKTIEICVNSLSDALILSNYPIDRIEYCAALELGGLTPSLETFKYLRQHTNKKICVMIRPRGGDFIYNKDEMEAMLADAKSYLENGADGIVFGFLNSDNTIQQEYALKMIELIHSYKKEAVFHKAFDECSDVFASAKLLHQYHIDRILTQGKEKDIVDGCDTISKLKQNYPSIQFLPGGGVTLNNIQTIFAKSKADQIHMSCKKTNIGGYICLDESLLKQYLELLETF